MSTKTNYIKTSAIRKLVKSHGKRTSQEFLIALDHYIQERIEKVAKEHNGGKKTLDAKLLAYLVIGNI